MKEMILQKIVEMFKKPAIAWIFAALMTAMATVAGLKVEEVKSLACSASPAPVEIKK